MLSDAWERKGGDLTISPDARTILTDISADGSRVLLVTDVPNSEGAECLARTGDSITGVGWRLKTSLFSDVITPASRRCSSVAEK